MDPNRDEQVLEAILCALLAEAGGSMKLPVSAIAAASGAYRLCPQTDPDGRTITLTLKPVALQEEGTFTKTSRPVRRSHMRLR